MFYLHIVINCLFFALIVVIINKIVWIYVHHHLHPRWHDCAPPICVCVAGTWASEYWPLSSMDTIVHVTIISVDLTIWSRSISSPNLYSLLIDYIQRVNCIEQPFPLLLWPDDLLWCSMPRAIEQWLFVAWLLDHLLTPGLALLLSQ